MREKFSCDIQIRFNSNQKYGGAWLAPKGKGAAAAGDVGVNAALVTDASGVVIPVFVYIAQCALKQPSMANSMGSRPYLYLRQPCVEDAVAFVFENAVSPPFAR